MLEPRPSRDIGEVRYPQHVRCWRVASTVDVIEWHGAALSRIVVRIAFSRITTAKSIPRICQATVQRAIGKPRRIICRQTLPTP